jgi:hypothetical protein
MRMFLNAIKPRRVPRADPKSPWHRRLVQLVSHPHFEHLSLFLTAANTLVMTLEHHGQSQL